MNLGLINIMRLIHIDFVVVSKIYSKERSLKEYVINYRNGRLQIDTFILNHFSLDQKTSSSTAMTTTHNDSLIVNHAPIFQHFCLLLYEANTTGIL